MSDELVKIGELNDFPVGALKRVLVGKDAVVVANVDGRLYAIGASCTHRGGPLDEGELQGTVVTCPWHGGQFDLNNGGAITPPPTKNAVSFKVEIKGQDVMIRTK
jgi:nitrite reductase/ring-hydroxylating ferredoxin subunit